MRWIINDLLTKPPKIIFLEDLHVKEIASKENRKYKDYKEKLAFKNITEASMRKFKTMLINRINKIKEKKTGKERDVPMPSELYAYLTEYAISKGRKRDETIFTLTSRAVTKYIKKVTDYLGLQNVSSHSWRKMYALNVYKKTGNDIVAVQQALLHSSLAVTQRYLNRRSEKLESVLQNNCSIVYFNEE